MLFVAWSFPFFELYLEILGLLRSPSSNPNDLEGHEFESVSSDKYALSSTREVLQENILATHHSRYQLALHCRGLLNIGECSTKGRRYWCPYSKGLEGYIQWSFPRAVRMQELFCMRLRGMGHIAK